MLKVGYRIRLSSGKGPDREGVIMRVTGSTLRVRWQTEDETTLIPAPGTLTVLAPAPPTVPTPEAIVTQSAPTKTAAKKTAPPKKTAAEQTAAKKPAAKKLAAKQTTPPNKTGAKQTAAKKTAKRATKRGSNTTTSVRRSSR